MTDPVDSYHGGAPEGYPPHMGLEVKAALQGPATAAIEELGDFEALLGVRQFPVRVKCALLPWTTLDQALTELEAKGEKS